MSEECCVCGRRGGVVMLENDTVRDKGYRRRHRYNCLFICPACLKEWREAKMMGPIQDEPEDFED